jgi:hypothetical protein
MAITVTTLATTVAVDRDVNATSIWSLNATSTDASLCEEIKATPGAGYRLVIKRLIIYIGAAITITLGENEIANNVGAVLLGPLGGAVGTCIVDCRTAPIVLSENVALTVDTSAAGQMCVYVEGYTKPV